MRTDRPETAGGGTRGMGRGRVGSSTYGTAKTRPLSAKAKKTIKAKEDLPLQRAQRSLEGKPAKGWKPETTGKKSAEAIKENAKRKMPWAVRENVIADKTSNKSLSKAINLKTKKTTIRDIQKMQKKTNENLNKQITKSVKKGWPAEVRTQREAELRKVSSATKIPVKKKGK